MAWRSRGAMFCGLLATLLAASGSAVGREEASKPQFKYAAGTESLSGGCEGNLEVSPEGLTFKCVEGVVTAPFSSISLMQYRSDVSKKVRRLKVPWKVQPDYQLHILYGKRNRFFSVVYQLGGTTHVMVLQVPPQAMRPYLAEIDLRAQKRVEVQSYEEY